MFVQTLVVVAAAATFAPTVLAQSAGAPAAVNDQFEFCEPMGNDTNSLTDILTDEGGQLNLNMGDDSVLAPILEEVSPETQAILTEFDVTGENSYTLLLPLNEDNMGNLLSEAFELNSTAVIERADDIVLAHILPGTLNFQKLQEETNSTGEYTVASLQGFEWTFGWDELNMFAYIVDEWNATTTAEARIEIDADKTLQPNCPNLVIGIKGFVVTPDLLPEAPTPAPAANPPSLPPPPAPVAPTTPIDDETTTPPAEPTPNGAGSMSTSGLAALASLGAAALGAALL